MHSSANTDAKSNSSSSSNSSSRSGGAPRQLVRSTGVARRPRRQVPATATATLTASASTTTQPPAAAAARRRGEYRSEKNVGGNLDATNGSIDGNNSSNSSISGGGGGTGASSSSTTQKPTRAWRTWPAPPTPAPPASLAIGQGNGDGLGVGVVGQQTPHIRHQLQSWRSFAARVESTTAPATPPRLDGRVGGNEGGDVEDEVALLTGGRIPRSFSTSAQTRVAAVHRRRGVEVAKGAKRVGMGLPVISETMTVATVGSAGVSRAAPAAVAAAGGREGGDGPPRLPFLAFSGTGHLPLQDGDAAARAARKNALLTELYALETQSAAAAAAAGGGQGTDAPHERERQIIAELMDLVHEYGVVEENEHLPVEQGHGREERRQEGAVVELPAYDDRANALPQPAYSRRPVWPGQQLHPQHQALGPTQAPSPELYASEPWAVRPRRPGVPVIGLGNVLHEGEGQDEVYGEEGQSSRSFPAKCSEFQVETLFRESMVEARRRQEEEAAERTAGALPSIYMIGPTGGEPTERTMDPRYNAKLDDTRLTPPGAKKTAMRRRLGGLRPQGADEAPEVVTAEMLGVPEIAGAEQEVQVEGAQCRQLEPGELPLALATMRRQGSGRQGLGARNSLKKSWRSFWNLR